MRAPGGAPRLGTIPAPAYSDYRYRVIFGAYKWDPQVGDHGTVSRHAVLMNPDTADALGTWAEQLAQETVRVEEALIHRPDLASGLGLPRQMRQTLHRLGSYDPARHVRLMRFDFHPTTAGWAVSEVNSDVPGGLAEASVLPGIAAGHFPGYGPCHSVGERLLEAFRARIPPGGAVGFVHCTAYADDRQVMQYLGDAFEAGGLRTVYAAPDHLRWDRGRAVSMAEGQEGPLDGIVRFFPLEWLTNLPRGADWRGFYDTKTVSCNHPVAIFAQSKRLPLVWEKLGMDLPAWRALLPETREPRGIGRGEPGWIYKPALGRVGEGISIREAIPDKEFRAIGRAARLHSGHWLAQRRFESLPLTAEDGTAHHLCVGVFTVDGKRAGFYGRISATPRIDAGAEDIPLLVRDTDKEPWLPDGPGHERSGL